MNLDLQILRNAVGSRAAAFRCITDYQPAGGPGDKVFPPTYQGGTYATEDRVNPDTGEICKCVLLDSVQSQANRMELALLEEHRSGTVGLAASDDQVRSGQVAQEIHGDQFRCASSDCGRTIQG